MSILTTTLVAEGSSDRVLIPLLQTLLSELCERPLSATAFAGSMIPPSVNLRRRIERSLDLFPCEILFVHRDADGPNYSTREDEIRRAMSGMPKTPQCVCVVPVRMTEAWLLTQEAPIRQAVGNPHGTMALGLPPLARIESIPDPKEQLLKIMTKATNLNSRRSRRFVPEQHRHKVGELTLDIDSLRKLPSFARLEANLKTYFSVQ